MLILRVEDRQGRGPYCIGLGESLAYKISSSDSHNMDNRRPAVGVGSYSDGVLFEFSEEMTTEDKEHLRFGFGSLEQLDKWFDKRKDVEGQGISVYAVEDGAFAISPYQASFDKRKAELLFSFRLGATREEIEVFAEV